jgi:ribulose-phosphate 3-epimerase
MSEASIIAPSILSANFACLKEDIQIAEQSGANWIHIDVMDGHFVPNLTMGPFIVETVRKITALPLDVHLMITNPESSLSDYAQAGADHLIVHIETCPHIYRTIELIHSLGCKAGVAINPGTPVQAVVEVLPLIDIALVMSVNPGFSGQKFIPGSPRKVKQLYLALQEFNSHAIIEVDGGITSETLPPMYSAGARAFVAASAIFKHPLGIAAGVKAFQNSIQAM